MPKVLIFCPSWRLEPETIWATFALQLDCPRDYLFTHDNPYPRYTKHNALYNYQRGRRVFLEGEYTHLLIIESDVIPPPDAWTKLSAIGKDVALGVYPYRPMHSGWSGLNVAPWIAGAEPQSSISLNPDLLEQCKDKVIRTSGQGIGLALVARHVLEAIDFRDDKLHWCDWPFTMDILANGFEIWADMTVRCGHKDENGIIYWPFDEEPPWFREQRQFIPSGYDAGIRVYFRDGRYVKIKALTSFAGPHGSFAPDNEYTVPEALGYNWIDCGFAEQIEPAKAEASPLREPTELQPATAQKAKKQKAKKAKADDLFEPDED